jgi:hypothetical protein
MLGLGGAPMSEARAGQGRAANDARGDRLSFLLTARGGGLLAA